MKSKISVLFIIMLIMIFLVCSSIIANSSLTNIFGITSSSESNSNGTFCAIPYGASIKFVEGTGSASISNGNVVKGEENQLKIIGTGKCDVVISTASVNMPYSFFSWNYKVKGGNIDVYSNSSLKNNIGTINGECYLVCIDEGNALKIVDYLYSSGYSNVDIKDKYISKTQSSTYFENNSAGNQEQLYISLKTFSFVKPVVSISASN